MNKGEIIYLKHEEIDQNKWDDCISNAPNGLIYGYSYYLNHMAENWDGLVLNDYEAVMPLIWNKKMGIKYLYTPYFISQLGIFGNFPISNQLTSKFIYSIPDFFSYADLCLNEQNQIENSIDYLIKRRTNYIIPLQRRHEEIYAEYSKEAKKNIRQAYKNKLKLGESLPSHEIIKMYSSAYGDKSKINERHYQNFENLIDYSVKSGRGISVFVKDFEDEICASAFFGIDHKRIYYLIGAPTEKGRKLQATSFMINEIIKRYSGTGLIFDFEGSDLSNVAAFYKKFSPQKKEYFNLIINKLPLLLKWIK